MKNCILIKTLLYLACACLIMFYLYAIYLGFNPQVSEHNRAYYIDHTNSQWPDKKGLELWKQNRLKFISTKMS